MSYLKRMTFAAYLTISIVKSLTQSPMKKSLLCTLALAAAMIATPYAEAQGRRSPERTHSERPGRQSGLNNNRGNSRPSSNNSGRPSTGNNSRPGSTVRPGQNHKPSQGNRPGNNWGNGHDRPGQNHKPEHGNRPGNNWGTPNRPGNNFGPGHITRPGNSTMRPGRPAHPSMGYRPGPHRPAYMRPPMRPSRPPMRPWVRPVPPPAYRPSFAGALMGNILGLSFGIAINTALDNLYYSGYNIDGYMNNQVYLTGVNQFNYFWPDATLFFGNGGLVRSQFYYPSVGFDTSRFYEVYNQLCYNYGAPASQILSGTHLNVTWFGGRGDYIQLQYAPMTSGQYGYFTILTLGR